MAKRGVYKHLKRIHAPKGWMLSKVGGIWATKPSQGPHKLRECIPLNYLLRNKLRVALNGTEAKLIVKSIWISLPSKKLEQITVLTSM